MTREEEVTQLRAENQALREALNLALEQLSQVQEQLRVALARIKELEKQKMPSPAFVKENVKKPQAKEKKPRKKRDAKHNHGRQRTEPTQIVELSWLLRISVPKTRRRQSFMKPHRHLIDD
jgi:hypothetical protein